MHIPCLMFANQYLVQEGNVWNKATIVYKVSHRFTVLLKLNVAQSSKSLTRRRHGSFFGLCDGSDLGTCLLMGWWGGAGALAVCRANLGLPVGFFLLRYSVLFTVESISLLYLLVIS